MPETPSLLATLPPGPVADRLADAILHMPDRPDRVLTLATQALDVADGDLERAFSQTIAGIARYLRSEHDQALDLLTPALATMDALGDLAGRSMALGALASVYVSLGHYDQAVEHEHENLRAARALGNRDREARARYTLGNLYNELDQSDQALEHGEAALRLFYDLDDADGQARALIVLGGASTRLGRHAEAQTHLEAALRLAQTRGSSLTESRALHDLGRLALAYGDGEQALEHHRRAVQLRAEVGNRQAQASSLIAIGDTLTSMGLAADARMVLNEALEIATDVGAQPRQAQAHAALARAAEADGDADAALAHLHARYALQEELLSASARSRIQSAEARAEAERAQQDAVAARLRTAELDAANAELSQALKELRAAQGQLVQAEKLASLGRLSAGLAHEIQNPLSFVTNFSQLNAELAGELLDAVQQARGGGAKPNLDDVEADLTTIADNARRVSENASRAGAIVRGLMGHVRDVGGALRPTDLHGLLDQAAETVLGATKVVVERDYADGVGPVAVVPASMLRVFVNLLDNARWAVGDAESATVRLSTEAYPGGVEIRVTDDGIGIPLADCTRVFEPFFTTKASGDGVGLGLSLAYDIVTEGHGGTLAAISRHGQGATFVLTLPVANDEETTLQVEEIG